MIIDGYVTLPSGLIVKYGFSEKTQAGTAVEGEWRTVSFYPSFPTACIGVFANRIIGSTGAADDYIGYLDFAATKNGFKFRARKKDDMYWLAIGY